MALRIPAILIAVFLGVICPEIGIAQDPMRQPYLLQSLESWVGFGDVIVRGVVVDISADQAKDGDFAGETKDEIIWKIVTLDVQEVLRGDKVRRLTFAVQFNKSNRTLDEWKKSRRESLWVLHRIKPARPTAVPELPHSSIATLAARHKTNLNAPLIWKQDVRGWIPAIPLGSSQPEDTQQTPRLLSIRSQLKVLQTSAELDRAVRKAIAEERRHGPFEWDTFELPKEIAQRTGHSGDTNFLSVPRDHRLEDFARRLVLSPGDFLTKTDPDLRQQLRFWGVASLHRQFRSEKNLPLIKSWLDHPLSVEPITDDGSARTDDFLPPTPWVSRTALKLPLKLADVPEVHFQQPLTSALKTDAAQLHTALTIGRVRTLNQKKTDGFIESLMAKRPELAGLSFAMGDACRMKSDAGRQFKDAAIEVRQALNWLGGTTKTDELKKYIDLWTKALNNPNPKRPLTGAQRREGELIVLLCRQALQDREASESRPGYTIDLTNYLLLAKRWARTTQEVNPQAQVAALMQVFGGESAELRRILVKYLDGVAHVDATRALARLAIFSAEPEVRSEALCALKMRRDRDYTDILLAGLGYPWPAVAERSSEAIVQLGRTELVPHLREVLKGPDPRAPQTRLLNGKQVAVVRELVRINHHHNCLLCHAPAASSGDKSAPEEAKLLAQVPVPSEALATYYSPTSPDILVRFDVTYLHQDFSIKLPVANADPWPEMQRYDFLVRTREVSDREARIYRELLPSDNAVSPYHRAALSALRELTGRDGTAQ